MDTKTPRPLPKAKRGVFVFHISAAVREKRWHDAALWSALVFAVTVAVVAIGWATLDSGWGGTDHVGLLRRPGHVVQKDTVAPIVTAPTVRRPIDGAFVAADAPPTEYFAVMIDNHRDAWPQAGVARASLVIEAPVEGGITRFMAVYQIGRAHV